MATDQTINYKQSNRKPPATPRTGTQVDENLSMWPYYSCPTLDCAMHPLMGTWLDYSYILASKTCLPTMLGSTTILDSGSGWCGLGLVTLLTEWLASGNSHISVWYYCNCFSQVWGVWRLLASYPGHGLVTRLEGCMHQSAGHTWCSYSSFMELVHGLLR